MPWARAPEIGLPQPDLVVFLDLEPEEAKRRGEWGGEKYERGEMQRKVRELFRGAAGRGEVVVVDAGGSVGDVAEGVWRFVRGVGGVVDSKRLGALRRVG